MGIKELAAKVAAQHSNLTAAQAAAVLRTALSALREELEAAPVGSVKLAPLGQFKIAEKGPKDGAADDAEGRRKISLRLAKSADERASAPAAAAPAGPKAAANAERRAEREAKRAEREAKQAKRANRAERAAKKAQA